MTQNQMVALKNGSKLRHYDGYYVEYYRVVGRHKDVRNLYHMVNIDTKRDTGEDTVSHDELNTSEWSLEE